MKYTRKLTSFWLIVIPTIVVFYLSLRATIFWRYSGTLSQEGLWLHIKAFSWVYVIWLIVLFAHNLFEVWLFKDRGSILRALVSAMSANFVLAAVYFYVQPDLILTPRRFLFVHILITFLVLFVWYSFVHHQLRSKFKQRVYLLSINNKLNYLLDELQEHDHLGFEIAGTLDEDDLDEIEERLYNSIIVLPDSLKNETVKKLYRLRKNNIVYYNHRDFYEKAFRKIYISGLDETWFLKNIDYRQRRIYLLLKRAIDILAGIIFGMVFIVTFPVVAPLVKLSSKDSVFFIQKRTTMHGKTFKIYKYRTMKGGDGRTWTKEGDPRITFVGKFLRRTRLDELPQFINLIKGDLSLVGPRPEQTQIVEKISTTIPFYLERHMVKSGLTGWAQLNVYAGNMEETRKKLEYDLYYIKNSSLLFDLEVMLKTFYHIVSGRGK